MTSRPRLRVLLVEDEWLIADHLGSMLDDLGYEVVGPVATVPEALAKIEADPPHAALLDVSLANGDSFPIAEALARLGAPFVFLTGYVANDLPAPFKGRPILAKPVAAHDLGARLAGLLNAGER